MTEHDAHPTPKREPTPTAPPTAAPRQGAGPAGPQHPADAPSAANTAGHEDGAQVSTDVTPPGIPEAAIPELVIISGMSGAAARRPQSVWRTSAGSSSTTSRPR